MNKQKVILVFSNVIDSAIYRGLIDEFSHPDFTLVCIFLGTESRPLFEYTRSMEVESRQYRVVNKVTAISLLFSIIWKLLRERPNVVLTFGQTASLIGLPATFFSSRATRIYLRMHTSMNHIEHFSRGILYDKFCNLLANKIVVPNRNTMEYLEKNENVNRKKVYEIKFGFNLEDFRAPPISRIEAIRNELQLTPNQFVIGVVSRYSIVKGLEYSIPAVTKFLSQHREAVLILAGIGENPPADLLQLIREIDPKQLRLVARVEDMPAFYKTLSVFIHTPIDETVESFGLVYVESFAAEVATIVTLSGIAKDVCVDGENCLVVDFCNTQEIENSLDKLFIDKNFRSKLAEIARQSVSHLTMTKMRHEYRQLLAPPNQF